VENASEHPLGQSIVHLAEDRDVELGKVEDFETVSGKGVKASFQGEQVFIGTLNFLKENSINVKAIEEVHEQLAAEGKTVVTVATGGRAVGVIALKDPLKPNARETIDQIKKLGLEAGIITGDNRKTAEAIGEELGITAIISGVLPEKKAEVVKKIQEKGHKVAMVGDGINDAPALAQADVGIALGSGAHVAMEAADMTLLGEDMEGVVRAIDLSRVTFRKIKQNLFWAFFYNTLLVPLAVFGVIPPMAAAAAMAFSSVSVVSNSLLLKRYLSKKESSNKDEKKRVPSGEMQKVR
jgi:P-type Cu+ transporter